MIKTNNMKKYLIKIDKKSIKKNKDAGSRSTIIFTGKTARFKARILPEEFIDNVNCKIEKYKLTSEGAIDFEGLILTDELIDICFKNKFEHVQVYVEFHSEIIYHDPINEYSYKYKNTKIKCNNCNETIMSNDLESDENDNGYYSDTICPKCGEYDCCELEYKKIETAIK